MQLAEAKKLLSIPQLWTHLGLPGKPGKSCRSPWRRDRHPSFSVFADGTKWKDYATGDSGDVVDFFQQATGLSQRASCQAFLRLASSSGCPRHRPMPMAQRPLLTTAPTLTRGTEWHWLALARTRSVSFAAVELAAQRGLLRFGKFRGRDAWFVTDSSGRVIQARRLSGNRWWPDGPKAMNVTGSIASWPVGAADMDSFFRIVLVEGGPDLLAAFHFIILAECVSTVSAVSILGAANNIHPEALGLFTGKAIRIIPHLDQPDKKGRRAGTEAAHRWQMQLQSSGATVEIMDLKALVSESNGNIKDVNDAARSPIVTQLAITDRMAHWDTASILKQQVASRTEATRI